MNCPKCQTLNQSDARFCVNCGEVLTPVNNASVEGHPQAENVPVNPVAENPQHQQAEANPYIEKTKAISKSYWAFALEALKAPYQASKQAMSGKEDSTHGLITLILFALMGPLTLYTAASLATSQWGFRPPFFDTVILPFILFVLFLGLMIGIIFATSRLMKSAIDLSLVFTKFMTLMVIPAALSTLAFVFALIKANLFSTLLLSVSFFILSLTGIATIFSIKEANSREGGLDVIYVILIYFVALIIALLLFGDALIGQFINQFNF